MPAARSESPLCRSASRSKWMRSSPSGPDPLEPSWRGFAHRGLHGSGVPENTLPAFSAAIEFGAGIECDIRLTADDEIIIIHDADARRLCASPLQIARSNWTDLAGLRVGGHSIPRLEALLALTEGQVPLLLEAKVEHDCRRWLPALRRELAGYGGAFAPISFVAGVCRVVPRVKAGGARCPLLHGPHASLPRDNSIPFTAP